MATGAPKLNVTEPSPVPSRVGLLASALNPPTGESERWWGGFAYDPLSCVATQAVAQCGSASQPSVGANLADVEYVPIVLTRDDTCTARSATGHEQRARQALEAGTQRALESELWTGTLGTAQSYPNNFLAKAGVTVISGTLSPADALGCLEQYAADTGDGLRAMIHATRKTATAWTGAGLVRREGNLLLTGLDTIVVAGVGYPGTNTSGADPGTGDHFAYVTDLVTVRLGPVEIYTEGRADSLNKADNTITVRAYRFAAATWDGCRHAGVRVDLTAC